MKNFNGHTDDLDEIYELLKSRSFGEEESGLSVDDIIREVKSGAQVLEEGETQELLSASDHKGSEEAPTHSTGPSMGFRPDNTEPFDIDIEAAAARLAASAEMFADTAVVPGGEDDAVYETMRIDRQKLDEIFCDDEGDYIRKRPPGSIFSSISALFARRKKPKKEQDEEGLVEAPADEPVYAAEPAPAGPYVTEQKEPAVLTPDEGSSFNTEYADESGIDEEEPQDSCTCIDEPLEDSAEPDDIEELTATLKGQYKSLNLKFIVTAVSAAGILYSGLASGLEAWPLTGTPFSGLLTPIALSIFLFAVAVAAAYREIANGFLSLAKMRAVPDSIMAFCAMAVALHSAGILLGTIGGDEKAAFYGGVTSINMAIIFFLRRAVVKRALLNLDMTKKGDSLWAVRVVGDGRAVSELYGAPYTDDGADRIVSYRVKAKGPSGFADAFFSPSRTEDFCAYSAPIMIAGVLLVTAATIILRRDSSELLSIFCALTLAAAPFTVEMTSSLPYLFSAARTAKSGAVMCSPAAAEELYECEGMVIDDNDLFCDGRIILKGMKIYNDYPVDEAIIAAASLLRDMDCALSHVFLDTVCHDASCLKKVDSWSFHEGGGVEAKIEGHRIMLGSHEYIKNAGIFIPGGAALPDGMGNYPVYFASDSELACIFTVHYHMGTKSEDALKSLSEADITLFLKTCDMNLDAPVLTKRFNLRTNILKQVKGTAHATLKHEEGRHLPHIGLYTLSKDIGSFWEIVSACRRLSGAVRRNAILSAVSMALSPLYIFGLIIMGGIGQVSAINLLVLLSVWTVPVIINSCRS